MQKKRVVHPIEDYVGNEIPKVILRGLQGDFEGVASVCFEYLKTAAKRQSGVAHNSLTTDTFTPLQITVNGI